MAAVSSFPFASGAKDIKEKVMKETVLDEQIKAFCALRCVGNEKEGSLKTLTIDPRGRTSIPCSALPRSGTGRW